MKGYLAAGLIYVLAGSGANMPAVAGTSILAVRDGNTLCTGTQLSGNLVLTASHCAPHKGFGVLVGLTHDSLQPGTVIANDKKLLLAVVCSPVAGTPAALATTAPSQGSTVTIGVKGAAATSTIKKVDGNRIEVAPISGKPAPCSGDSGGPVFAGDKIAGVLDKVIGACGVGNGIYSAVYSSPEKEFINAAVAAHAKGCQDWVKGHATFVKSLPPGQ